MLPPKNWLSTTKSDTSARAAVDELVDERFEDLRAVLAGDDGDRRRRRRAEHAPGGGDRAAWRPVALGRRTVDPREEAGPPFRNGAVAGTRRVDGFPGERGAHLGFERARHADAVLVLRQLVVGADRGKGRPAIR